MGLKKPNQHSKFSMREIIYYVAASIDGFIAGADGDVSGFVPEGSGIDQYFADLKNFDTVIMGRKTYEFGYQYGLEPGQPAYPHMEHYIFSSTLRLSTIHEKIHICPLDINIVRELKNQEGTPIYLCGGGQFARWLLDHELIDVLKIKLNPFVQGEGIRLFGNSTKSFQLELKHHAQYDLGLQIMTYQLKY